MITITGIDNIPEIERGDDIGLIICEAAKKQELEIDSGDVLVVTHKIVSKSEGRIVNVEKVVPSPFAEQVSKISGKDPRHVEIVLNESKRIVRMWKNHLITENKLGLVCANAAIDRSNISQKNHVALLPEDPDLSARKIRNRIKELTGSEVAVIISDTFGRPWRSGQVNIAVGISGMIAFKDYRGKEDSFGHLMSVTNIAIADELASAAELVMNKVDRVPVAIIKGYEYPKGEGNSKDMIRPSHADIFI